MEKLDFLPSILIEDTMISWQESLAYLQLFGKLKPLVQEIVSEYLIVEEIKKHNDLEVQSFELEQTIINFRVEQKLTDSTQFNQWMEKEALDYPTFQKRILLELKIDKLKTKIAEPKLQTYFEKQKDSLKQVDLDCLISEDQAISQEFKSRLTNQEKSFEELAKDYGSTVKFTNGITRKRWLPKDIQNILDNMQEGELTAPIAVEDQWAVLQLNKIIPAVLDEKVEKQLKKQIFREWLANKINSLSIKLSETPTESPSNLSTIN